MSDDMEDAGMPDDMEGVGMPDDMDGVGMPDDEALKHLALITQQMATMKAQLAQSMDSMNGEVNRVQAQFAAMQNGSLADAEKTAHLLQASQGGNSARRRGAQGSR